MKHRGWIAFSGTTWLLMGMFLIYKGVQLFGRALFESGSLIHRLKGFCGGIEPAAAALIAVSLIVGLLKGRFVLSKTVTRLVSRIASLPLPIRLKDVYGLSYLLLIGGMMALGMLFRFLPIPVDAKGMIKIAIGSALINGSLLYFRAIQSLRSPT